MPKQTKFDGTQIGPDGRRYPVVSEQPLLEADKIVMGWTDEVLDEVGYTPPTSYDPVDYDEEFSGEEELTTVAEIFDPPVEEEEAEEVVASEPEVDPVEEEAEEEEVAEEEVAEVEMADPALARKALGLDEDEQGVEEETETEEEAEEDELGVEGDDEIPTA